MANTVKRRRPLVYSAGLTIPGFAWVQSGGAASNAAPSLTATFTNPVAAGDLVVVLTACYQAQGATVSVTDNHGNTYHNGSHANLNINAGANEVLDIWYCVVATGGPSFQVTMTPSVADEISLGIAEFAFNGLPLTLGASSSNWGISAAPTTGNLLIQGSDLVVAATAWGTAGGNSSSPGPGFTSIFANNAINGSLVGFASEYQTGVTANPTAGTFGLGGSVGWGTVGAAFNLIGRSVGLVARGMMVGSPRRRNPGRPSTPRALPPAGIPETPLRGLQVGPRRAPRAGRACVGRAVPSTQASPLCGLPVVVGRGSVRRGQARTPRALPAAPPILRPLKVVGPHPARRGRAWLPSLIKAAPIVPAPARLATAARRTRRRGTVWSSTGFGLFGASSAPIGCVRPVTARGIRRLGQGMRSLLALPSGPSIIVYRVYSNTGAGDPIDYGSPIATVATPGYQTSRLAYPGTWSFGVRAFDLGSGLEEQNVDAAITMILDPVGNDVTNRPSAPNGLRAFALAGGSIRVEWGYPNTTAPWAPSGFHVYLASSPSLGPALRPVTAVQRTDRRRPSGRACWRSIDGGNSLYSVPVATVLPGSRILNSYACDIPGLLDGVAYTVGVRAFNATAEETNTITVSVVPVSVGPSAVESLTAIATA
jgi:hypothetical protein